MGPLGSNVKWWRMDKILWNLECQTLTCWTFGDGAIFQKCNFLFIVDVFLLRYMPQTPINGKSTLVQLMAWCHQATNHFLSQCWPRSMSPYGITRPQWVNDCCWFKLYNSLRLLFYTIEWWADRHQHAAIIKPQCTKSHSIWSLTLSSDPTHKYTIWQHAMYT